MSTPSSLVDILLARAEETPERRGYVFLDADGRETESLRFGELDLRARAIARALQEEGAGRGERALLLYPPGLEFVAAFFGCLYAGIVAVPVYPPRPNRSQERLRTVAADCEARLVLAPASIAVHARNLGQQVPLLAAARWLTTDLLPSDLAGAWTRPPIEGSDLAFLQYTSGSTATPKGVMVTHGNLLHNEEMIRRSFGQTEESVVVGWLPLYHDMGLIGNVLQPLSSGGQAILMSPMTFLQRPAVWLETLSRYRGTTSGGPNFAYDLCVRKVGQEQRERLDLSCWTVAFNGAEPVRAETMRRFREAFAPCGFRPQAFFPCYGLAEATLFVTGGGPEEPPVVRAFEGEALERSQAVEAAGTAAARELVGCGRSAEDQRVAIVDPASGEPCPVGDVGEIWVRGPSVAAGYWNQPEESARVFQARLGGQGGPFLRTGDLGFLLGSELFVTGRLKDLIILRGRNHYPQDIEQTVERSHPALRPGCGAAFSVEGSDGEEQLILLQEVERRPSEPVDFTALAEAVQRAVSEEHDARVAEVVLLRAGTILKTSSGKIRRRACRAAYLAGELEIVARSASTAVEEAEEASDVEPGDGVQGFLVRCAAEILKTSPDRVSPQVPLPALGLDSLAAAELRSRVEERYGAALSLAWLLEGATLADVSEKIPLLAGGEPPVLPPSAPASEHGEGRPLSPNQRALWIADRLSPASAAYNLAGAARIRGRLDPAALARAFQILVDRHAALRTAFVVRAEDPLQTVLDRVEADCRVERVAPEDAAALEQRLDEEAFRPFDLESGSLMRVRIWSLGEEEHRLLLVLHHLVSDFASIAVLLRELSQFYRQETGGPAAPLAPPGRLYSDHLRLQERELAGPRSEELWSYWQSRLAGRIPALDLAADRPRPPLQTYAGGTRTIRLGPALSADLVALGLRHRATLYMTLLAGFHALLQRYGQGELAIGAPTAGRSAAGFERVVGYFVNPVALRLGAAGDVSFAELLSRTRKVAIEAFEHQGLPFGWLTERLLLDRDPSRSPLFQTLFVLHRTREPEERALAAFALGLDAGAFELGDLRLEPVSLGEGRVPYDLTLSAAHRGEEEGIAAALQYNRDLFDGESAGRMLGHLANLLRSALSDPERRVAELALLSEAERRQLLEPWNLPRQLLPEPLSAQRDFELQAARIPDAVAVAGSGEALTYGELDSKANRLARYLIAHGVGPDVLVAIALDRTPSLVTALLGVLKSGGAYVPLDPRHPRERLARILEDARPAVVITEEGLLPALPTADTVFLCLDRERPAIERQSGEPFDAAVDGEGLAYVIFTSGSTGQPKGVQIPHRALVNFLRSMSRRPGLGEEDVLLAVTTVSFDIAALELLLPLSVGARVELATPEEAMDPVRLQARLSASGATVLQSTPATWTMLLEAGWEGNRLLTAFCGGEALSAGLARDLLPRVRSLWNLYGPTETTVWSAAREVSQGEAPVLVGGPIANTWLYLLGPWQEPVPFGVPGELYIGGKGLARGYLGRPDLTAEQFVPDPFAGAGEPGVRMYRVGDLARRRPDGLIEFLGRTDHQVKIRGFRIELGEVERALAACTGVRQAVAAVREDASGAARLVAYAVPEPGERPTLAGLRSAMGTSLPDYMLPAALVLLEALPLNPSGKVDRRALPTPGLERETETGMGTAPLSPTEELLAGIWGELLGIGRMGRDDSFFDLGGNSLLATRVVSRVRQILRVELPLRSLFEAPTLAGFAARIEEGSRNPGRSAPRIVPVPRQGELPLSFAQQRLWFLDQLAPGSAAYNMPFAVRLEGELDLPAFAAALSELVRRQESLRTVFPSVEGRPVQAVLPASPVSPGAVDLAGLPGDLAGREAERLLVEEAARPFDLARGPLLRLQLLRLSPTGHLVLVSLHHIIADGWSLEVLFHEVAALYGALREHRPSPLAELPVQYADFAVWQREWLRGEVLEEQLGAWRRLLAGLPPQLDLPTDRPRPARSSSRGGVRTVDLGEELSRDLVALSRKCGATLFMTLLAGFQALLGRCSGRDDIPAGSPIANRNRWETEGLIGFFVNTLVLRGDLSGAPSFRGLLARTRETTLEAYAYQDLPFEKLVEELAPERNLSASPLFQVFFVLQNDPPARLALPGLRVEQVPVRSEAAQFSLSLDLTATDRGLAGTFEYSRDLFDGTTIARWAGHLGNWLRAAVAEPDRRISELPLLAEGERQQVLREWNENGVQPPQSPSIVRMFERRVDLAPEAPALFHAGRRLTYGELDRWANRLAHRLLRLGVGPEVRVAVLAERSPELFLGMLGILKAGGAYVPLDAAYPKDRLAFMLEDSAAAVLLTQERLADRLPEHAPTTVFLDAPGLEEESPERPARDIGSDHLAYVIYTSGSTGRPKGTMVSHQALASYTETVLPVYGVVPGDRVLQFCSVSFDISLEEIVPCLTGGAELVLRTEAMLESVSVFLETCRRWSVTMMSLPTAYWHEIVAKLDTDGLILPASLRLVIIAGERALPERLAAWRRHASRRPHLINTYGLTESTIISTVGHLSSPSLAEAQGEVSVGRVIPDTEIHLFDAEAGPVPIGVAGELHIGGGLLARGYLNRPEVTAERFVPHPFSDLPGARLYRTGDLARALPDGELVFLGRGDRQVKVRGYRIELEEIEARLLRHPEVESALVTVREDRAGDKQIVGYLVFRQPPGPGAAELRAFLREALPDYMVPGAFVTLDAVPLTPNGKVDRARLPAPDLSAGRESGLEALTPVEGIVAGIWSDVLGLPRIGAADNFFALGGHSLLATQAVSRLQRIFGIELPLRRLFEAPTVAELARAVEEIRSGVSRPVPRIVPAPREAERPLSFAQQRLWFIDQLEPGTAAYNMPFAVRLEGELDLPAFAAALSELARRQEALRTVFPSVEGRPIQVVLPARPIFPDVVDLGSLPEGLVPRETERLVMEESERPFDLVQGPLLRLRLLRLSPTGHLILATLHHIIGDGWSVEVLVREVAALYGAFRERRSSPLAELPVQYADFAVWQREWLQGEVLEEQLGAWRRLLAGLPAQLDLPTDRPRPVRSTGSGGVRTVDLGEGLSLDLLALSRRCGATLFMTLLAGFQALLGRLCGRDDIPVGSPIANRNRWETEGLIGFFVNTLVLRGDLSGPPSFRELLDRTRETTLEAYAYQDLPFEKLVEELAPERNLSTSPLFQVLFVLQNAPPAQLALPDLLLEPVPIQSRVAKFSLSLDVMETDGGLTGTLEYSRDLFDGTTIGRWAGHLANWFRAAVAEPDRRISELPLLDQAERQQVLREWNENGVQPPRSPSIVPMFERRVDLAPAAPALFHVGRRLTYGELDRWANRLAHRLRRLGVGPEVRVAVLAERSPELIVALLGILKAGGAYVPLDAAYPQERLVFMLEDSQAHVLLTQQPLADRLPAGSRHILFLDLEDLEGESAERPLREISPDQLAYVIYTSGSTGRPKGGMISHRALSSYTETVLPIYGVQPGDHVLQFCSISFDTSLEEIAPCLTGGAELVLRTTSMMESMAVFLETCRQWSVTVMCLPTAFWHEIVAKLDTDRLTLPPSLRLIVLGGERALPERLVAWRRHAGERAHLINTYGLTESTITSTVGHLTRPSLWEAQGEVSLGRVIPDTEILIFNPEGGPAPIGLTGELWVGGGLLARGYQNRPEVTAERFVPHPFSSVPGARLYRTGDLARALPNGELVFLGRGDRQVKVRGYRIELEEIEARLLRHPEVESALVTIREDRPGDKQIVGYLVFRRPPGPAPAELRAFLREALPDYMVPGAFVMLDAVPLTPNGKVDRGSLPAPAPTVGQERGLRTPVEQLVAEVWADVLGLRQVGADDNFFALGGHSLLVTQVAFRLQRVFGIEVQLRWLFEAPTVAELAARVEEAWRRSPSPSASPLVPRPRGGDLPLSFAQQRLWLIDQLEPGSPAYNLPAALRLRGRLAVPALAAALGEIVRRHEVLRTVFRAVDGEPLQVVAPPLPVSLPVIDLSGLPAAEPEARRQIGAEASRPFDLACGPLVRYGLLRLGPADHIAVLNMHHIVSDGWSGNILIRELTALYGALLAGEPSPLAELPIQYADFAFWQRDWLRGEGLESELAYWREQLRGAPPVLELPTDRPRPAVQGTRGGERSLNLPSELATELTGLARREAATPFMVLLAAFQTLLHRYSGKDDISVGTPVAGRNRVETGKLIGFFVNTLVLRGDLSRDPDFLQLLARLRDVTLQAYRHQDLPFEKLVEELRPERSLSHTPLFQVMLALQNGFQDELELPGVQLTALGVETGVAKFDLLLELGEGPAGLAGTLQYREDLFDAATAQRLTGHFQQLLRSAAGNPGARLSELELLSEAERHQLLEWNATEVSCRTAESLHELILEQAARTPDAIAVVDEQKSLTYGELAAQSVRLARHLQALGVGLEVRVGICLERSVEMVVGLLGILAAGGTYVPLDPSYPPERLAYMLEDSAVEVLLVRSSEAATLPDLEGGKRRRLVDVDHVEMAPSAHAAERRSVLADNLAYVIYTSGSTGRPKGAMNTHRGIVNRLLWMQSQYGLTPEDRILQKTPFSFDVSVWELFWPLLQGARLVMARPGGHQDGGYLVRTIAEQGITTIHFVPSMLGIFLETPGVEQCTSLRRVIVSGEALPHGLQQRHFSRLGAPLHNLYGPTEAAVDVTWWACDPADPRGLVPIGRPVANTAIHLLDPSFHPVPMGVAGQLCIGGVQLARGYLGRPDLTAEKFLPDPQGPAGARIYATGDLARRLPAGEIDYLGRIDHQVKVRGFRVELGEIESVLAAHPGVLEAVVVARSETAGARLVAYVVADAAANRGELVNGLRRSCREALPEAMMPSAFVVLDALPLTPNGKVDRRALPAPPSSGSAEGESPGPRTPVEEIVAAIWSEVLGVERVGVEESFFDLGGHSLLANQVVSRLRVAFRVELPLRDFFAAPTVKNLARWIETAGKDGASLSAPPLVARPRRDGRDGRDGESMSFAQQRLWFLHQLDPESTAYHVPIAVRLEGALAPEALASALEGVVRRHEALRTTFALRADGPVQVIAPAAAWTLPVVDLSGLGDARREAEMQRLVMEEVSRPFDLTRGPLLRTSLVRLRPRESVLLALMHHIVSDAWSMAVLWRETVALYRSAVERRPADLPELPIQYSDFAQWQRELLSGEVLETQLSYWRRQLAGAPTLLELPTDRARPRVQRFHGGRQGFSLPAETTRRLQELGRREGATLFMTLLAAFDALLHRYSRQEDVVVGFPIAGRSRVETEGLIGLFINTLALRAAVPGASSWLALLRQVREVSLAGYAHQDLPFEKLVAELDVERSLAHAPLFQTLLVMQNIPALRAEVPDLTIEPLDLGTGTAKFDLVLNVEETAGALAGRWLYNSELFEAATVARMSGHFEALLTGILADPGQRIEDLPLLGQAERQQMVVGWNDTAAELPLERTFQELFEAVAERAPASLAVVSGPHRISYGELNARANRLARSLLAAGVGREDLVAVLAERGADLLVAMLALFKAGGVYLPLDPHHPAQRLLQTIEQSASRLVLVSDAFRDTADIAALLATEERKVLALSELLAQERPAENLACRSAPAQLAYVLFTSGSTGAPKGVMIPQRGMVNHLWAKISALGLTDEDRVAETALQTFDISIWQFLAALLVGGSVHILPDEIVHDPLRLLDEIEDQGITIFETVPSLLSALLQVDELFRPRLASLRWLIPTGEALPPELCREWLEAYPAVPLVNAYGPTECSDDVTHQILRQPLAQGTMRTPIGSPVLNTRIYVMEPGGDPAPVGVPGELAVGGVQVGRGYWGRPDLTAERFVPDAFGAEPGARLYRTGDLARWRDTGEVEFLGRIDYQVKVRGFRIELGDIEAALLSHPAVREAVVLARAQPSGALDQRLVAYLVAEMAEVAEEIAPADLRTFLHKSLPEYMVPSAFVVLERLPLTANGKVDRKALPAPEVDAAAGPQGFMAPRTDLERSLCELWAEVLGLAPEQVGVQDSFFEIGGDSIRGAILINRLQKKLGQIVHVVALFDHPKVAELAAYLMSDYPEAVAGLWGLEVQRGAASAGRIGTAQVALLREIIPPLSPAPAPEARNPPAVFVLSAPRSGSTLLRVMLGGHPRLFAPPELELLSFTDMAERRAAFSGRNAFWLEGLLRTVMEALHCSADEAKALVERCEDEGLPTRLVYRRLQQWIGARMLVDKTPSYALSRDALERAETDFDGARYIHLIRHPKAVIHSFEEARLDQVFFRHAHLFTRRELAELIWTVSHQNIVDFLTPVPAERQHWVRFEELVRDPVAVLSGLCEFLGIDFHPDMAKPYKEAGARMTDGLHAQSRMLGDVKFHQHAGVEAGAAERWRQQPGVADLGEPTHQLASLLGYETRPAEEARPRALPPLVPADRSRPLPLSFAQQRLWFLDQLSPGSSAYNIPASVLLIGRLDVPALAASLGEVVRRHETLRTTFGKEAGEPVQRIAASGPITLPVVDLRGLPAPAREAEARSLASAEAERAFDLARDPLLRSHLVALSGEEQVILLTMHHIVSDGWSQGVLVQELASLYEAFSQGRPSPLPELPIQYADFACWQRQWLAGEVLDAEIAYWKERLAGAPPRLELPTDRPRPAVQTFAGANCAVSIPGPLVAELKEVGRSQDATLFMALLAAFQALLCRYSGQTDLSVGTPSAGRNHFETEKLIGFFVNTLVLRTELSGEPGFSELTARVRETALEAYLHQDLPFEMLVEQLRPERSLSHSPLFQVMLALQNAPQGALTVPGLQFEPFEVPGTAAKFDLMLTLVEAPSGLLGTLSYNRDLFEEATVRRLAQSWIRLVQAAVAEPESRVLELPLLAPAERDELVAGFNSTARDYPPGLTLHELIEAQTRRSPEAIAVSADTDGVEIPPLTYRELDRQANQLAHFLRSLGVAADSLVGVCMERSLEMVVALVGILKAGGAYVPLDPGYPAERLAYMLEDAGAPVLLTQSHLAQRLPARGARIVALDTGWPEIAAFPAESLRAEVTERHLAYVIYTSGSTGRPKGAMLPHSGICNRLLWMQDAYGLTPEDRVLQKTPFSFDVSVWEFFWPLITGARLVMARPGGHQDPFYLVSVITRERITTLHFVPSMLQIFLEQPGLSACDQVRRVICSGEALPDALRRRFHERMQAELHNLYGPTEASVDVTFWPCEADSALPWVPIGRPIANTQIYLLDPRFHLVPLGVAGELCIGGVSLARGYLRRPGLTAERFVPDPFGGTPGGRLYRTGDLARLHPDGAIEYLGRIDHQVKIRGFRIELGEIESVLAQLPGVREAVVLAREGPHGERRLAAWIVTGEGPLAPDDLRQRLRARLPEHMVPADFSFLESLPLTPNGKVDRRALPAPDPVRTGRAPAAAPRDEIEHRLAEIWAEILGLESVGVDQSFFDLGGHSLSAVRLMARIEDQLGQALPLSAVFQAATVERMASLLRTGAPAVTSTRSIVVKLQGGSRRPFFCVHPIGGNVFCYVSLARALGPEQPFYGLQVPDLSSAPAETFDTIEEMSRRYVEAMREVQPTGPYRLGGWSMGAVVAFEMARQLRRADEEVELVAMLDAPTPGAHRRAGDLDRSSILADFARDLTGALLPVPAEELRQLDHERQLAQVLEWAKETGALPASETLDRLAGLFATFERNLVALSRYEPGPYPGQIELFRASDTAARRPDPGWAGLAHGGATIHEIPGDHYSIVRSPAPLAGRLEVFLGPGELTHQLRRGEVEGNQDPRPWTTDPARMSA
jgi:amino acid adenylation domain-containing protein